MLDIYTDGSCLGNPGPGGYAIIYVCRDVETTRDGGCDFSTTNNVMELEAVTEALRNVHRVWNDYLSEYDKADKMVTIHSDSSYVVNAFNKGWLSRWSKQNWRKSDGRRLANHELWIDALALYTAATKDYGLTVKFKHVRGHSGHKWNEECDRRARENAYIADYGSKCAQGIDAPYPSPEASDEVPEAWKENIMQRFERKI